MRVLGRVRLSRLTEESTSIQRQRGLITSWAEQNGHEVVAWAEDIDVSGSLSPFDAPELGKWFTEEYQDDWDILCAWKLDRIARNSIGLHKVFGWLQDNDKALICISDNIDLSTWVGRLVASVIAGVAEGELEAISERGRAGRKALREAGRWHGGRPCYGYHPVKTDKGWKLDLDRDEQIVLQRIIGEILRGRSAGSIAKDLNEEGIPTAFAGRHGNATKGWTGDGIRQTLRNKALLGWTTHEARPILDPTGKPVLKGPPSVTLETFQAIQNALDARANIKANPDRTSALLGVLKCWVCGQDMHIRRTKTKAGTIHSAYLCRDRCTPHAVNEDHLLPIIEEQFAEQLGDYEILEKKVRRAGTSKKELEEARQAYDDLAAYIPNARGEMARRTLFEQLEVLDKRIQTLESMPIGNKIEWEPTGRKYIDEWNEGDEEARRLLMVRSGVTVRARQLNRGTRHGPGIIESEFIVPEDLLDRLRA